MAVYTFFLPGECDLKAGPSFGIHEKRLIYVKCAGGPAFYLLFPSLTLTTYRPDHISLTTRFYH